MKKLSILLVLFCLPLAGSCPDKVTRDTSKQLFEVKKHIFLSNVYQKSFSVELLKEAIYYCEIKHPEIVFNQMKLESANFTSDLFRVGNNLTGMRLAKVRPSCAIGEYDCHAIYAHWYDSVVDYALLQEWYADKGHDLDTDYYTFLWFIGYATDRYYIGKLKYLAEAT